MKKSDIIQPNLDRIQHAFQQLGIEEWEPTSALNGGLTDAPVYKIKANNTMYAIKLESPDDNNFDLKRNYQIVENVSKAGISPPVVFTDPKRGIILMKCIESRMQPATATPFLEKLAGLARKLHQMERFSEWKSLREIVDFSVNKLPPDYLKSTYIHACLQEIEKLEKIIFLESDIRSSHGDFHIANTLFDGENYYLVDWQAAAPRSFYFDLACYATFMFGSNTDLCHAFLKSYLEREPTMEEVAKYDLMRVYTNIYYGVGFVSLSVTAERNHPAITNDEIAQLAHHGNVLFEVAADLANPINKEKLGFACLKSSLKTIASPQYKKAFELVSTLKKNE